MSTRPDRRTQILATAARMYAASGFHGVSVDDLGAELGISGPAIYRYFPGKEAILAAMLVDISQRLLAGARERVARHDDPEELLTALIAFHADFALSEPELIAVQFRDLDSAPDADRRRVRSLQRQYVAIWVEALAAVYTGVAPRRAQAAAQAVFGLLNSTPYSNRPGAADMPDLLHLMAHAALAAACTEP